MISLCEVTLASSCICYFTMSSNVDGLHDDDDDDDDDDDATDTHRYDYFAV